MVNRYIRLKDSELKKIEVLKKGVETVPDFCHTAINNEIDYREKKNGKQE